MSGGNLLSDAAAAKLVKLFRENERRIVNLERRIATFGTRRHSPTWFAPGIGTKAYGGPGMSATSSGTTPTQLTNTSSVQLNNNQYGISFNATSDEWECTESSNWFVWFGAQVQPDASLTADLAGWIDLQTWNGSTWVSSSQVEFFWDSTASGSVIQNIESHTRLSMSPTPDAQQHSKMRFMVTRSPVYGSQNITASMGGIFILPIPTDPVT